MYIRTCLMTCNQAHLHIVRMCGGLTMELHTLATVAGAVQCKLHRQDGECAHCT